jgi:hypothetical protein
VEIGRFLWKQPGEVLRRRCPSGKASFRLLDSDFHLRSSRQCCRTVSYTVPAALRWRPGLHTVTLGVPPVALPETPRRDTMPIGSRRAAVQPN